MVELLQTIMTGMEAVSVRQPQEQTIMGEQLLIITINMAVTSVLVPTDKKVGATTLYSGITLALPCL
jgi:hypothetical protein